MLTRNIREFPILTSSYDRPADFRPTQGSAYVYGQPLEDRAGHVEQWQANAGDLKFVVVEFMEPATIRVTKDGASEDIQLRSLDSLTQMWRNLSPSSIYLDITAMDHAAWAPLLRSAVEARKTISAVYVEPLDYRFSASPTEGQIFDLSESIRGIEPIPGFASLSDSEDESFCFVPIVGFEGTRLAFLLEHVQPQGSKIVPIVGIPGFRPEYPFHAYLGNKQIFNETRAWKNIRYSSASCPFDVHYLLQEISESYPGDRLKISPIGTKPHALGAVLYCITNAAQKPELVYDHPRRHAKRTAGAARLHVYHISQFLT